MSERKCKYKIGDVVKIVNYGSILWWSKTGGDPRPSFKVLFEDEKFIYMDPTPELVGQIGVVDNAHLTQNKPTYAIDGPNKHAWYNEDQLKLMWWKTLLRSLH